MDALFLFIAARKAELDRLRPLAGDARRPLQKHHDVELTYTSNAIAWKLRRSHRRRRSRHATT